jgi:DNA-binding MarR family transcriptional regulator
MERQDVASRRPRRAARGTGHRAEVIVALDCLRRIVRALHVSHREAEQRLGISGAQLLILQKLAEAPAESVNDLAERTFTHQSTVSTVVDRLVARRLVRRRRDDDDGRRVVLSLTPAGRALLRRALVSAHARLLTALDAQPAARLRSLARDLAPIVRALGVSREPVTMLLEDDNAPRRRRRKA